MPRGQFNVRTIYTRIYIPRPGYACWDTGRAAYIPGKSTSSISMDREFYYGRYGRCLVCIDYRMHAHCENRRRYPECWNESHMCVRSGWCCARRCNTREISTRRFLSRICSVRVRLSRSVIHDRFDRRQAAESRRRNNRVCRFFDLFEIESIARWPREKCIYTAIEFHRVDCTIDTAHSLPFRWAAGRFRKMHALRAKTDIIKMQQKFKRVEFHRIPIVTYIS